MRLADGDYWIDDYGVWNHVAFGQLCPFFSSPVGRSSQALDLAFRHLGMVRVCKREGTVTIQWDIAEACDESLTSASAFLWDLPDVKQAKLRFYYGGWTHEIFDSIRDALVRLEILRGYSNVTPFPGVRTRQIGVETRERAATQVIKRTRQLLARNGNRLDATLWNGLARENLMGRLLLFQEEDDGAWLSYRFIGRNSLFAQVFGTSVLDDLVGKHCAVDPSENQVGYSASRSYTEVVANDSEQLDQVFMPVKRDDDDGVWVSYQRMLTTCKDSEGRRMLLLLTDHTQESLIAA